MNMHGIVRPEPLAEELHASRPHSKARELVRTYRFFLMLVILPTLVVAAFYYLIASNQYESRADFVVRRADVQQVGDGFAQIFGMNLSGSATTSEAHLVSDYLLSHDAVARLRKEDLLVDRFRRSGTDWISRLWPADPTPEKLLSYYRRHVSIDQDPESGISHLSVRVFSPEDSYAISRKLLALGEERINQLNERTYHDAVTSAARDLDTANNALSVAQQQLTGFRRGHADIDPEGSGKAQIGLVSTLTGNLVAARARLRAMEGAIGRDSPQYRAAAGQVHALEAQTAGQSNRLAGTGPSIAASLGDYEELVIRRENAARRYATVAAQYDRAKAEAERKQVYLVRVVDPNMPVKSLFPKRGTIVLTVFFGLALAYGIGWLLLAGVREHSL
jgi:capsular polysaccharide transport system permease protein